MGVADPGPPIPASKRAAGRPPLLYWLATAAGAALLFQVVKQADPHKVKEILSRAGPSMLAVLAPFGLTMVASTIVWKLILRRLGFAVRMAPLLRLRFGAEAVVMSVPGGALINEALKPWWLRGRLGIDLPHGAASVALKKAFIIQADGIYQLLALGAGLAMVQKIFIGLGLGSNAWLLYPALAVVMIGLGTLMLATFKGGSIGAKLVKTLRRLPVTAVRRGLDRANDTVGATDRALRSYFAGGAGWVSSVALLLSVAHWLLEAVETYVIFRVLGVEVSFTQALTLDALSSVIRSAAFFMPAGIGVQDVGILFMINALGVASPVDVGSAFILTKRSKELFWIAAGYACLLFKRRQ